MIALVPSDEVTYWRAELESHDVMFANGFPADGFVWGEAQTRETLPATRTSAVSRYRRRPLASDRRLHRRAGGDVSSLGHCLKSRGRPADCHGA